ncbi:response regulator [Flavobacterium sp. ALD4]|uniref:response regulator transcription factor n=1 Tax=Flavobacterium sp. ALD4 TaxID=2058314 RepID=UPI000C320B18|nr:response regulator transcription factor [Flavobacterium sp. ALD4]PKH68195.1 response regulator [Flavobacterium sp. ALD4]
MFKKVLIAEDLDIISIAVVQAIETLSIEVIQHSTYCDDAFLKIKKALQDNEPYDLLISDLSFKTDHRENKLTCGEELIEAVKKIQPDIKTIVFSIEDKSYRIKSLFNNLGINAYVSKGRNSIPELKNAVESIFKTDEKSISSGLTYTLNDKSLHEIEAYDISLLKLLSNGCILNEISVKFKNTGIIPNGSSSIEKRINKLKIYFKANNNVHLIAIAKDLGLV